MGDCRDTAVVALWNQHATTFDVETYLQLGQDQPLVFLFCAVTSRMFQGKLSLQGSTLCKWYANPALPEVAALKDSCFGRRPPPAVLGPDFFQNEPERISVAQLSTFTNPHIIYNKRYIITAKIKQVVPNQSWWYLACDSCKKTVQQQGGGYKCKWCRLCIYSRFTKISCATHALYGKVYELRVSVSPGSLQRINITYQVYGIIGAQPVAQQSDQVQQTTISVDQSKPHEGLVAAPATPTPIAVPLKQVDKGGHTTPITEASQAGSISVTTQLSNTPPPPTTPMAEQVPANTKTQSGPQKRKGDDLEDADYEAGRVKSTSVRRKLRMPGSLPDE
ncbi:hypothetical protein QOZ80_2AG0118130 [Eleusine coracana subsp. coracana]|nr:hypothetical protein QOZ80_2AG0118130 [Eleusine coracana subsp. coracana]